MHTMFGLSFLICLLGTLVFVLMVITVSSSCIKFKVNRYTVKILKIGTPEIITIIVVQLEQLNFTLQYCVQKMQTV